MAQPRRGHQALLLANNNTVLIAGGTSGGAVASQARSSSSPGLASSRSTGSPASARTSAVLSNLSKDGVAWLAAGRASDGARDRRQ